MFRLSNGNLIPKLGYGTYKLEGIDAYNGVKEALNIGYRHIDTATYYNNEKEIGRAIKDSNVKRQYLFITTKIWNDVLTYEDAKKSIDNSLKNLGLEYIDLVLIHWPNPIGCRDNYIKRNNEVYRAMEDAYYEGKIKNLGLSNFETHHIEEILKSARVKPVVNQFKYSVGINREKLINYCKQNDIVMEAWSPLEKGLLLNNPIIKKYASQNHMTEAQLLLNYCISNDMVVLVKSANPNRMKENFDIVHQKLDMTLLKQLESIQAVQQPRNPDCTDF